MVKMMRDNKGFSLVELMVVVAIIGILAAIAVPNFQKFAAKSKQSEAKSNLAALYSAERSFYSEWQTFSTFFGNISYAPTGKLRYRHGFTSGDPGTPQNYSVTAGASLNAWPNSTSYCNAHNTPANADYCTEITLPLDPGTIPTNVATSQAFTAGATANLNGVPGVFDTWTIDQSKTLINTNTGY